MTISRGDIVNIEYFSPDKDGSTQKANLLYLKTLGNGSLLFFKVTTDPNYKFDKVVLAKKSIVAVNEALQVVHEDAKEDDLNEAFLANLEYIYSTGAKRIKMEDYYQARYLTLVEIKEHFNTDYGYLLAIFKKKNLNIELIDRINFIWDPIINLIKEGPIKTNDQVNSLLDFVYSQVKNSTKVSAQERRYLEQLKIIVRYGADFNLYPKRIRPETLRTITAFNSKTSAKLIDGLIKGISVDEIYDLVKATGLLHLILDDKQTSELVDLILNNPHDVATDLLKKLYILNDNYSRHAPTKYEGKITKDLLNEAYYEKYPQPKVIKKEPLKGVSDLFQ